MAGDGTRPPLHRRLAAAATERLALKAAALFFACVLWLVVSAEEPTEQVVQVLVYPRLDSTLALVGRRPTVRALVVGRARELIKLAGESPVVRPVLEVARGDSVVLTIRPEDVELPADAQLLVREVRPRTVAVRVTRVAIPAPPATAAESALAGLVPLAVPRGAAAAVVDSVPVPVPAETLPPTHPETTRSEGSVGGDGAPPTTAGTTATPAHRDSVSRGAPPTSRMPRPTPASVTDSARRASPPRGIDSARRASPPRPARPPRR